MQSHTMAKSNYEGIVALQIILLHNILIKKEHLQLVPALFLYHQKQIMFSQPLNNYETFFISSEKLFSFLRYSNVCISNFPPIFSYQPLP